MMALFTRRAASAMTVHQRRQDHWAKVHIAADRREPFLHLQPRKPNLVLGCRCGRPS